MPTHSSDDVPASLRQYCYERDNYRCRLCGVANAYSYALHHINYRSQGGPHAAWNLVLLCEPCHRRAHSRKMLWQPLLLEIVDMKGVTALQLKRWREKEGKRNGKPPVD